jgi:hypothetical protein
MPYAIIFPIILQARSGWGKVLRFFSRYNRNWDVTGEITLGTKAITVKQKDIPSRIFPITELEDLELFYWGYDMEKETYGTLRARKHIPLDNGDKNFIHFKFHNELHSYEFYIEKEVYVNGLKKILSTWYENNYPFTEYYGKLESYLLKHKHIIEMEKKNEEWRKRKKS